MYMKLARKNPAKFAAKVALFGIINSSEDG